MQSSRPSRRLQKLAKELKFIGFQIDTSQGRRVKLPQFLAMQKCRTFLKKTSKETRDPFRVTQILSKLKVTNQRFNQPI